ncbi:MAG: NAD(P)/FAD-dependent oxidoreductase [Spirochaetaceae bacterium]
MTGGWDVIVIGGGAAGVAAAEAAKAQNSGASVLILHDEKELPYVRTKLSKLLASGFNVEDFLIRPQEWYDEQGIELRRGVTAESINPDEKIVQTSDGESVAYGSLVLATGGAPAFPGNIREHEAESFYTLKTVADAARIKRDARRAKSALVVGMGVLSVEIAQQLSQMKTTVTLVGATGQLMPRQLSPRAGEIMEDLMSKNNVRLQFQEEVLSFEKNNKRGMDVMMIRNSGRFDMVIFCIGFNPDTDLARSAGLDVNRGVKVDDHLRTSNPDIYAAGDLAEHPDGTVSYLWNAAQHQGSFAGRNAAGGDETFDARPFRLRTEAFGTYFLSVNKPRNPLEYEIEEAENGDTYYGFYFDSNRLIGAVVVGDKERADDYERAVQEGWSRDQVNQAFFS